MSKLVIIVVILTVAGVLGLVVYSSTKSNQSPSSESPMAAGQMTSEGGQSEQGDENQHLEGANIGESVDATNQNEVEVVIDDFIFETTGLTVTKGTTVTWVNRGNAQHDVQSSGGSPSDGLASELLGNGDTYSYTFDDAGTYNYFCSPHPTQMRAVVEVVK